MKAAFHYAVKVKLIRYETKDDINFINYEKVFENESPIIARQEAFREYEAWINDLYEGIGKPGKYSTDKQARIDLKQFITPSDKKVQIDEKEFDIGSSLDYGIGIYFIIDQPYYPSWENPDMYDKTGDEEMIHGIGTTEMYSDPLEISDALNIENLYYNYYNYDKGGFQRATNFYDYHIGKVEEIHFLETPFDWTDLGIQSKDEAIASEKPTSINIEQVIQCGEGNQVEFKPALLYNFKTDKAGIGVKGKIATTICAFLNSNGGLLFIGLNDDGIPQGLDKDFGLSNKANAKDYFQNEFDQMLEHFLSFSVKSNIIGKFYKLEGKDIFIVFVEPSQRRAIFVTGQNGKEFWVRGNAGNRQLKDIEELANYCIDRWTK